MSWMSANYIVRKIEKYNKCQFWLIFRFLWKWAHKQVSHISDISHVMNFIIVVFIFRIFGLTEYFQTVYSVPDLK